eukprot:4148-Heterococcus_DN1.PRE.1
MSLVESACSSYRAASYRFDSEAGSAASNRVQTKYNIYPAQISAASYILCPSFWKLLALPATTSALFHSRRSTAREPARSGS